MNNNKVIGLVVGGLIALFAVSLVLRFVLLSEVGVPGYYYFGLPIGGISVIVLLLLRLGVLNFGQRPGGTIHHWQQPGGHHWQQPGAVQPPPFGSPPPVGSPPPAGYQPAPLGLPPSAGYQPTPHGSPPSAGYQPAPLGPPPPAGYQPPAPSVIQRLQELETLRATGAISDTEYTAKRQQIISNL